jgi:integrase
MITKIKIRKQVISGNRYSLFLDYWPPVEHPLTGKKTRREFLNLFIFSDTEFKEVQYFDKKGIDRRKFEPIYFNAERKKGQMDLIPKSINLSPIEKQHNKNILLLAEQIKQKRENEVNKSEIYTGFEREYLRIKDLGEKSVIDLYQELTDKREGSNRQIWLSSLNYLKAFAKPDLRFKNVNEGLCNDYKNFLLTTKGLKSKKKRLSHNSALSYYNKFKVVLKQAYKSGYLQTDISSRIDNIKEQETFKMVLTLQELNSLIKTECNYPLLKNAALFSALTGLRFSDIKKLTWKEVEYSENEGYYLHFRQQKTKGIEKLPISEQAFSLMGSRKDDKTNVFEGLKYSAYSNKHLYQWIGAAGITKDITFHNFRHTYATLQLSAGSDIYVISKMLGHKNVKTTQGYTKVVDQLKRDTTDKIKLDL